MRLGLWRLGLNFPSGLLFPLMVVGMILAVLARRPAGMPIGFCLLYSLIIAAFFVCARFRQPIIPLAVIFGVYGVSELVMALRENRRRFALAAGALVVLLVGLNAGGDIESAENRSQFQATLGSAYKMRKDYDSAARHLSASLAISPDNVGVYDLLGQCYLEMGRFDQAEETFRRGLEKFPVFPLFHFGLGQCLQADGDRDGAKDHYRQALKRAPDYAPAADRLGYLYRQEGKLDSAVYYYEQVLRRQPHDERLRQTIQALRQALQTADEQDSE
jgi:tetratricopeptide (TPR) repeat protein